MTSSRTSDDNKARTLKAKAKHYQGQGHSPKGKAKAMAIPVGNEAGTVLPRTAMVDPIST